MNYLTTFFISIGMGLTSIQTDFNTTPLSIPFLTHNTTLRAEFGRQAFSLSYMQYDGHLSIANWAASTKGARETYILNRMLVVQVEQELLDLNRYGKIAFGAGLAFSQQAGIGFDTTLNYRRCLMCSFNTKVYLSLSFDICYWGEDGLEGYVNAGDVEGDFGVRSLVSLEIPLMHGRLRPVRLR